MKQSEQTLNAFNSINLIVVTEIHTEQDLEDFFFYLLSDKLLSIRLKSSVEKKEQEQSCWVLNDRPYCKASHRTDKGKEYALSIKLKFYASIAIHPSLVRTDGGTTVI